MKTMICLTSLLALSLASGGASAQGWFAGGSAGQARQQDYTIDGPITTRDDTDDSYRIFGGYLVTPRQGVVASFVDLGTAYYAGPAFGGFTDSLAAEGIDVSYMVGWAPGSQERVSVFGTVGVFFWDQDATYTELGVTDRFNDEGTSFSVGFGADFNLSSDGNSAWSLHVAYQLFKDVGDADFSGHENDRDAVSVGASYRFGSRRNGEN